MGSNVAVGDLVDGKYRIIRTIGEGGWGIVFEGENVRTFKRVAIKILRTSSAVTKDILTRFEREAQAAGRIGSEHIVEVFDLGVLEDGTHYMVMELLAGQELAARLRSAGPLDPVVLAKMVLQLLDGLKAAHEAGILHRDLKPENLFLVPTRSGEEFVKILDFGISKFNTNGPQASATMTGAVLGSPCYMAPEQARGLKQVDPRTDLYAVGTLMFESLTGRVPFMGDNFNDLMFKIVLAPRPDPRELRPDLDPEMALIIVKAMAIDPAHRYQNADEMSQALVQWLASRGIASVRPPELKRATNTTPRTSREFGTTPQGTPQGAPRAGTPVQKATVVEPGAANQSWRGSDPKPQWSDATMPAEQAGTPLASSSSDVRALKSTGGRSSRNGVIVVAAVVASLAIVGVTGSVLFGRGAGTKTTTTAPVDPPATAATSVVATASPPPPTASLVPPPETAPPAPAPTELATGSAASSAPPAHSASAPANTARFAGAAPPGTKPAATASAAPKPTDAPPATTAAAAPKGVGTVEGREIRTGL